jgi:hypothetical protein
MTNELADLLPWLDGYVVGRFHTTCLILRR